MCGLLPVYTCMLGEQEGGSSKRYLNDSVRES